MANEPNALVYVPTRKIIFATNTFVNVPTVLRVDGVSMIEVVQEQEAGYTVQIPIFHNDGTKLAVAKGSRLILTDAGKAAGLSLRHPNKMTVCEWGGKPIIELRRTEAAALNTQAELYTPNGSFIKSSDAGLTGKIVHGQGEPFEFNTGASGSRIVMVGGSINGGALTVGRNASTFMAGVTVNNSAVGIDIRSDLGNTAGVRGGPLVA